MKQATAKVFVVLALVTGLTGAAFAQTSPATENHEAHHPEAQSQTAEKPSEGSMMGSMKMDDMHAMMKTCMENHKDGKMCDHKMMEKCQAKMSKGECQKMMKETKKEKK